MRCRCGLTLGYTAGGDRVCPACRQASASCRCRRAVESYIRPTTPEELTEFREAAASGILSEFVEAARRIDASRTMIGLTMKEHDWSEDAIQAALGVASDGGDERDEEHRSRVDEPGPVWIRPERESRRMGVMRACDSFRWTGIGVLAWPFRGQDPSTTREGDEMSEQAHDTMNDHAKSEPRAQWIGVEIWNPTAALLVEKVGKDIDDGKLDPSTAEGRRELIEWTDLILRQEQIYGRTQFILGAVLRKGNFPRFLSKLLGGPVPTSEKAASPKAGAPTVSF